MSTPAMVLHPMPVKESTETCMIQHILTYIPVLSLLLLLPPPHCFPPYHGLPPPGSFVFALPSVSSGPLLAPTSAAASCPPCLCSRQSFYREAFLVNTSQKYCCPHFCPPFPLSCFIFFALCLPLTDYTWCWIILMFSTHQNVSSTKAGMFPSLAYCSSSPKKTTYHLLGTY